MILLLIGVLVYFFSNKLKESFVNDDKDFGTGKNYIISRIGVVIVKAYIPIGIKHQKKVKNKKVTMAKVNCGDESEEHAKIVKKYGVQGYPTIKLLNNGKVEDDYNEVELIKTL